MTEAEDKSPTNFPGFVLMAAAWTLAIAFVYGFAVHGVAKLGFSDSGTFGDSFGPLNACAAIFAAIMLIRALHIQMREFKQMVREYQESKIELQKSANAQQELLQETIKGQRIAGLTALLNANLEEAARNQGEIERYRDECQILKNEIVTILNSSVQDKSTANSPREIAISERQSHISQLDLEQIILAKDRDLLRDALAKACNVQDVLGSEDTGLDSPTDCDATKL
jgi:ketopantoate reductase